MLRVFVSFAFLLALNFVLSSCTAKKPRKNGSPFESAEADPTAIDLVLVPPKNPFLADSAWSVSHQSPYAQASSPVLALGGKNSGFEFQILRDLPGIISLVSSSKYSDGSRVVWGNSLGAVFKIKTSGDKWTFIDKKMRLRSPNKGLSGAYSVIDREGVYFAPYLDKIDAFSDKNRNQVESKITEFGRFEIPKQQLTAKDDYICGLNLTYDGYLVFVTTKGLLGVVDRNLTKAVYARIDDAEGVSNSIALDEDGGIFVVSDKKIYRFDWSGDSLTRIWSSGYDSDDVQIPGRLGKGSGTTPTLLGSDGADKLVAITDGKKKMNLLLYWRDSIPEGWNGIDGYDRRVAGVKPITFGQADQEAVITEQSLLGYGYEIVTVSNQFKDLSTKSTKLKDSLAVLFANKKRIAPTGMEKFAWDPTKQKVDSIWSNKDVSCPNSIPTFSEPAGVVYCIGARDSKWTLEGVRWNDGALEFSYPVGGSVRFNSYYAATQIYDDGSILSGVLGGIIKIK